ncbi:hypothetical protein OGAPHI_003093 [Ogataea philodendri]|uniref:Nucleoporin POM33 n=1 Tax=Ogataea philodendri TaxID=1378263 RepID=A0A9P8T6I9_9ASCO|nr:uncharacterized protein OGAPHI_003093 [Ogataea philodendri]KAH3667444.1 hypothetical protein OGAPHI_003093 [Ogataea philodendri]
MTDKVVVATPWRLAARQVAKLSTTAQFYWFLSHLLSLTFLVVHTAVATVRGPRSPTALRYYNYSITSTILTYAIVLRQTYKARPISFVFARPLSLLRDDNVQYFLLAVIFRVFSKKHGNSSTLYPFAVYAFFHCLGYINANILRYLPFLSKEQKSTYSTLIAQFVKTYGEQSSLVAAHTEVLLVTAYILPVAKMVLLLQIIRPNYLVQNVQVLFLLSVVVIFNKLRFDQSKYTRALVTQYDARINTMLAMPVIPPALQNAYFALRQSIIAQLSKINLPVQPK